MSIMGTRVVRTEDPLFLTRGAIYTDDLVDDRLTGAVHATFVRSQVAHGRLLSVDASAAREAPGVVAVYTAAAVDIDPLPAGVTTADAATDKTLLFPEAGTNVMASFGGPAPDDFFAGCEVV